MTPVWDVAAQYQARVRVEIAVGVLMECRGWDATRARSALHLVADRNNQPVTKVADTVLSLAPFAGLHSPR